MSIQRQSNNKRLLDALDYVDVKYVEELVGGLRLPKESAAAPAAKRSIRTSLKYAALIAACALILGAAIPVAGSLIRNLTSGMAAAGSDSIESEPTFYIEEDLQVKEQTGDAFEGSPLFAVMNTEDYPQPVCEVYTIDGEKLDICVCKNEPCYCYPTERKNLTICGSQIIWLIHNSENVIAACAYDFSDPDNVKYTMHTLYSRHHNESWYDYYAIDGTPCFIAYAKSEDAPYQGMSIWDFSELSEKGDRYSEVGYPSAFSHLPEGAKFLYADNPGFSGFSDNNCYFGVTDEAGAVTRIVKLTREKVDGKKKLLCKDVMDVSDGALAESRVFLEVAEDGGVHFFREEKDDKSEHGYSLYQYICREGEKTVKVLRAKNVSDYIVSDGYIYYMANDPEAQSASMIYRLPAFELDYKPMTAVDLGEKYENVTFLQGADGGIAVGASKKVGEELVDVTLLIGKGGEGTLVTEIKGYSVD